MSTRRITEALDLLGRTRTYDLAMVAELLPAARAEVEAIEKACRTLEAESIGDGVYDVRDRAASDTSFTDNTWKHPRVVAYGEAAQVISNIAKESK